MKNEQPKTRPLKEFKAGGIVAAIWVNASNVEGRSTARHSIRVQKRYREERTGEWKSTTYFRPDDMPRLALVANRAFEFLTLRENDEAAAHAPDKGQGHQC